MKLLKQICMTDDPFSPSVRPSDLHQYILGRPMVRDVSPSSSANHFSIFFQFLEKFIDMVTEYQGHAVSLERREEAKQAKAKGESAKGNCLSFD